MHETIATILPMITGMILIVMPLMLFRIVNNSFQELNSAVWHLDRTISSLRNNHRAGAYDDSQSSVSSVESVEAVESEETEPQMAPEREVDKIRYDTPEAREIALSEEPMSYDKNTL